ncbi:MAG: hypothetical protein QY318_02710 [Candidatus Dojkabacteria bacterium]|nr:MAG: hypothetical protein QY318_02710 [Candidatus Dojkabacteria bacterium]
MMDIPEIIDTIKYGVLKMELPPLNIPNSIRLEFKTDRTTGLTWATSPDLPAFVVTGYSNEEILKETYETLLVYFDVPTYFAKRMNDYGEITLQNGEKVRITDVKIPENLNYAK